MLTVLAIYAISFPILVLPNARINKGRARFTGQDAGIIVLAFATAPLWAAWMGLLTAKSFFRKKKS